MVELAATNDAAVSRLWPKWNDYIFHSPTPKQLAFLLLPHMEALYGGAAGGGKSDALLMAALQYTDVPNYAAVIFRRTYTDLVKPEALISRSFEWLNGTDARWLGNQYAWKFPSGAMLTFSYLDNPMDCLHHQSAAYQFIAFDELTQFREADYTYLFSRLRRKRCPFHCNDPLLPPEGLPDCPSCRENALLSRVPLRMRSATNPGGIGHLWVKNRFSISNVHGNYIGTNLQRPFIPARLEDNPHLDQQEYDQSLAKLEPITRAQLRSGDWGVSASGRFKKQWVRRFSLSGDHVVLGPQRRGTPYMKNRCRLFQIVDPAASTTDIWRKGAIVTSSEDEPWSPGDPSWTVVSTFFLTPDWHLIWWRVERRRVEIPGVLALIRAEFKRCSEERDGQPEFIGIEANGLGIGVYQMLRDQGLPVRDMRPRSQDKLVRATDAINRMEMGKIWLPESAPWLDECETELFTWTGHPDEQADQIDTLAYAAQLVSAWAAGIESGIFFNPSTLPKSFPSPTGLPSASGSGFGYR